MQALTEKVNSMIQVSHDSISVSDSAAAPKVWMGLTVLHQRTPHVKVLHPLHQGCHGTCLDPLQASMPGHLKGIGSVTSALLSCALWHHFSQARWRVMTMTFNAMASTDVKCISAGARTAGHWDDHRASHPCWRQGVHADSTAQQRRPHAHAA